MDVSQLTRDKTKVLDALLVTKDDRLVTKKKLTICLPGFYEHYNLATITDEVHALGVFAIITEDGYYAVNKCLAKLPITPMEMYRENVDGKDYLFMTFEPGSTVVRNINVMKEDTLTYYVYDNFISSGRIPWFMNYEDILTLFKHVAKYTGVKLGSSPTLLEMIGASIARDPKEGNKMFRIGLKSEQEGNTKTPLWVPLANVQFGAGDTVSRLLGSYFDDGLNSSLANPSTTLTPIEEVLRS